MRIEDIINYNLTAVKEHEFTIKSLVADRQKTKNKEKLQDIEYHIILYTGEIQAIKRINEMLFKVLETN